MSDVIALLPDHIANQIAAGEVIQRPASAVKEMLENAIDAGASVIHLIIRDAGKELIQVIDNGKGMSALDARKCFERHATSKIKTIDDLFSIHTMGFRGEALASIAAVAKVELKTKQETDEIGTYIQIENSKVITQEPVACNTGTNLSIKNLFFNVPARRNFLKSDTTEIRHIIDEFTRIALAFPEITFRLTNNQSDLYHLESGKLKLRILGLLGQHLNNKLVPVDEYTDFVSVKGFIGSPEIATRTRGNQYFFVNNRFIKSAYLNHAITQAYKDLLSSDEFPLFVLFIDIDPKRIDINVHPTKQEIKFEEDRIVYSIVNAAVRHALNKYAIAPSLDFNLDAQIEALPSITQPFTHEKQQQTQQDYLFQSFGEKGKAHFLEKKEDAKQWKDLYKIQQSFENPAPSLPIPQSDVQANHMNELPIEENFTTSFLQINAAYIIATTKSGCVIIDQQLAHQRILFERFKKSQTQTIVTQQLLHPITIHLNPSDSIVLQNLLVDIQSIGFQIEWFGQHSFVIQGIPADFIAGKETSFIEQIIENAKQESGNLPDYRDSICLCAARLQAIPHGKKLSQTDMQTLFDELLRCEQPQFSPFGKKTLLKLTAGDLEKLIQRA